MRGAPHFYVGPIHMPSIEVSQLIGPVGGPLVALFGFFLVSQQLRIGRESMNAQARGLIYQLSHNVYKLFVDRPELRPYFYGDIPIPTEEPERSQVLSAAELLCDYFEHIYFAGEQLAPELKDTWCSYMRMLYQSSDALKHYLDGMDSQYSPSFLSEIRTEPEKSLGSVRM